jgi:CubicO group peptidase (beta-lactamase class C family)
MYSIPRLTGLTLDGDPSDWGDGGLRVELLSCLEGQLPPPEDLDARVRLAWDDRGLWVLLTVRDDVANESDSTDALWAGDSVELFLTDRRGSTNGVQVVLSPGVDPKHPEVRTQTMDHRAAASRKGPVEVSAARTRTEGGYVLEVLLPWSNLDRHPQTGDGVGFQIYVNDSDGGGVVHRLNWYPERESHANPQALQTLTLAERPSAPIIASATGRYERLRRVCVDVTALAELDGKTAEVQRGDQVLASARLAASDGRAKVELVLAMPARGQGAPLGLMLAVDGLVVAPLRLPDPDQLYARTLTTMGISFHPSLFTDSRLPECDFDDPLLADEVLGRYSLKVTYYDADYQEVTQAEEPGRYGAVVEVTPEHGRPFRRFRTLFRLPQPFGEFDWWKARLTGWVNLPKELGVDAATLDRQPQVLSTVLKWRLMDGLQRDPLMAPALVGLWEARDDPKHRGVADDAIAQDRQWWVGLKRKLYGTEACFPARLTCPTPLKGDPAPTLRDGKAQAAGVNPHGVEALDALLQEWAADTDEGFAVCAARHGVIFHHKPYGLRAGRPMSLRDKSWCASITKLLSATLIMMLVDQKLVDLDDPIDNYLPAFRGIPVETPVTVRHLYTHTAGTWDHWGDDLHDFEEIMASYYPHLEVGVRHSYNGAGYALGGKIIEAVTGEAVPLFFKRHLLGPLGCAHTDVTDTNGGSFSIAQDLARIGQMLLNKGSYGDLRFFGPKTLDKMLPQRLTSVLGPDTTVEWGIGTHWCDGEGLGKGTYAHGAASAATLRIDPVNDLVLVMTRNRDGANFAKYHPRFIRAVADCLTR